VKDAASGRSDEARRRHRQIATPALPDPSPAWGAPTRCMTVPAAAPWRGTGFQPVAAYSAASAAGRSSPASSGGGSRGVPRPRAGSPCHAKAGTGFR